MSSTLEKALSVLEYLVTKPLGCTISDIANALSLPPSGVHRLLKELESVGYVRQSKELGDYKLTIKLASFGLSFLGQTGIVDVSQPILDNLAQESKELVRLSLLDNEKLVWVGVSQGAISGLRYDPGSEQGQEAHLASSAGGQAYLAALTDEEAVEVVMKQGLVKPDQPGDSAPTTLDALIKTINVTRERGYSINQNSFMQGMAAMAAVVRNPDTNKIIGCVSIAGPSVRLAPQIIEGFSTQLIQAALQLGEASRASQYFSKNFNSSKG